MFHVSSRLRRSCVLTVSAVLLLAVPPARAGTLPEQQCQAGKNKTAGRYAACRENAEANLGASGDTTKYGQVILKCADKFAAVWQKLEDKAVKAGTTCPSVGDATGIEGKITTTTDTVAALVRGVRFVDNGDGTIRDLDTGLQWQKPSAPTAWQWVGGYGGFTVIDFLHGMNDCYAPDQMAAGGGFAGLCDWRLPTIDELDGIVDMTAPGCGTGSPCIDPVFGMQSPGTYWSSSEYSSEFIWVLNFRTGQWDYDGKSYDYSADALAVRG